MATHNLDEPYYAPQGIGNRLDQLNHDLAETHAALQRADRECRQWKARALYYRDRCVMSFGQHVVALFEADRPDLWPGVQEILDRSA